MFASLLAAHVAALNVHAPFADAATTIVLFAFVHVKALLVRVSVVSVNAGARLVEAEGV